MTERSREAVVHRLPMASPGDVSALRGLFDAGTLDPAHIVAVIGKTEGNGGVNDFTRGFFTQSLMLLLADRLGTTVDDATARVPCVLSGGTEGVLSPHYVVVARRPTRKAANGPALAVGIAFADEVPPEAIGRVAQVEATRAAVKAALGDAGLSTGEVVLVQVKAPGLTSARMAEAHGRGAPVASTDTNRAMALSRSAAVLGAAVALGDVPHARVTDATIGHDMDLSSARVSVSSGIEITRMEVIVLGHSGQWAGPLRIACRPMADALDIGAVHAVLDDLGLPNRPALDPAHRDRVCAVLVKGMPDPAGHVRGHRHTMLDDTDINAQRHIRAALGGLVSGVMGDGRLFVSGGAEHQGPDGGGLIAVIAKPER